LQVILIDIVLAGDNAVVIGMAAARVPIEKRRKVIAWGLAAAVVLRVVSPVILVLGIFLGAVHFNPLWLLIPLISILVDVKRVRQMPFRDRRDLLLAVSFVPNEILNTLRCIWYVQAWAIVLRTRLTGRHRDLWSRQYAAEGRG